MSLPAPAKLVASPHTWEDFLALDEDDLRELIDGQLIEVEVPKKIHEKVVADLIFFLGAWVRPRKAGYVLGSGYKVRVSAHRGVMPDVQFYRVDNPAPSQPDGLVTGRPDLVIEVVSHSSRRYDRMIKLRWYAELEVPESWIVDPEARSIERLVLQGGHYAIVQSATDDETFAPKSFPDLTIELTELWADS